MRLQLRTQARTTPPIDGGARQFTYDTGRAYGTFEPPGEGSNRSSPMSIEGPTERDAGPKPDRSGSPGAIINLTNTVLGGGISLISLPLACKRVGVLLLPAFEVASFAASAYTCHLLVVTAEKNGQNSYASLGQRLFPGRLSLVVPCLICLGNFGVCVALLETFADVIPPLLAFSGPGDFLVSRTMLLVLVTAGLLVPVVLVRNITGFIVCSLLASTAAACFAAYGTISGIRSIMPGGAQYPISTEDVSGLHGDFPSLQDLLSGISIMTCSWPCQFNVLPIYTTLQDPTVGRMRRVIVASMGIAAVTYILFGVFAYLRHLDATTGDTLADFDDSTAGQILRVAVVAALILTFPLFVFEASHNLDIVVPALCAMCCGSTEDGAKDGPQRRSVHDSRRGDRHRCT